MMSDDYSEFVKRFWRCQADDLTVCAMGIAGEAGEQLEVIKKLLAKHGDPRPSPGASTHAYMEELGDLEFYLEKMRQLLGVSRETILTNNMAKLSARFPDRVT